jgi:hypothetical protein
MKAKIATNVETSRLFVMVHASNATLAGLPRAVAKQ